MPSFHDTAAVRSVPLPDAPVGLLRLDGDFRLEALNRAAADLLDIAADAVLPLPCSTLWGLSPDDLVMRSTLLGGARTALSLASMERTKQLDLSPELAAKMPS